MICVNLTTINRLENDTFETIVYQEIDGVRFDVMIFLSVTLEQARIEQAVYLSEGFILASGSL